MNITYKIAAFAVIVFWSWHVAAGEPNALIKTATLCMTQDSAQVDTSKNLTLNIKVENQNLINYELELKSSGPVNGGAFESYYSPSNAQQSVVITYSAGLISEAPKALYVVDVNTNPSTIYGPLQTLSLEDAVKVMGEELEGGTTCYQGPQGPLNVLFQ